MATTSKFLPLLESTFSRYTQGSGFLAGDVVKFKKNTPKSEWFLSKPSAVQDLVRELMKTEGNLRIGILKTEYPRSQGALGGNDLPASMADIYLELSPANWAYPMTVPLTVLERIKPTDNTIGGPVPKNIKDKNRTQIKGGKKDKDKGLRGEETKVDDSNRQNATNNTKLPNGMKWDDSKVGGGNAKQSMPGSAMKESTQLEDMYGLMLAEQAVPGSAQERIDEALSDKSDFEKAEITKEGDITVVKFHDSVYSSIVNDEVPVVVTVRLDANQNIDSANAVDDNKHSVPLTPKDHEYLGSRAVDFATKHSGLSEGNHNVVTIGKHVVTRSKRIVGKDDPTEMVTFKFDNGYTITEFFGDYELTDASDKRIAFAHGHNTGSLNKSLHHIGLPPIDDIYTAFENVDAANADNEAEAAYNNHLMGDMSP
jgi:hypothetical protein